MKDYYNEKLSAERLRRVYEIASPRVVRYLKAEIDFVKAEIKPDDTVIELGCGYGRVLKELSGSCSRMVGIDTSLESLIAGKEYLGAIPNVDLACMNAIKVGFGGESFDAVICIQNGISAFHIDRLALIDEAFRITKAKGKIFFSSYSAKFWDERLKWFEDQAEAGLLGEIDSKKTGNGLIVCKDGFTAKTLTAEDFRGLTAHLDARVRIVEVDESSLFCVISKR